MEFLILMAIFYFLPTITALVRGQEHEAFGIFLVNFFLGWTIIGWWVALIWAIASNESSHQVRHVLVSSGRFCSRCGTLSPQGAHFCTACGHAV